MTDPSQIVGLHRQPSNGQHQSLAASFTCSQSLPGTAFVWWLTMPTILALQDIYEKQSNLYRNTLSSKQRFATLQENEETFIPPQDLKVMRTLGEGSFASGQRQAMGTSKGAPFPMRQRFSRHPIAGQACCSCSVPYLQASSAAVRQATMHLRLLRFGTASGAITGLHLPHAACLAQLMLVFPEACSNPAPPEPAEAGTLHVKLTWGGWAPQGSLLLPRYTGSCGYFLSRTVAGLVRV